MKHTISSDRHRLTIKVNRHERALLRRLSKDDGFRSDATMADFLEPLACNSELQWIPEGVTGDLTSAPMLGIYGEEFRNDQTPRGYQGAHISTGPGKIQPLLERWAFMDYQVRSVLQDLRDTGKAVFIS